MQTVDISDFLELLENKCEIRLLHSNKRIVIVYDFLLEIDSELKDATSSTFSYLVYPVEEDGSCDHLEEIFQTRKKEELLEYLNEQGYISDNQIGVYLINQQFPTLHAYKEDLALQTSSLEDLLVRYPQANLFSLSTLFQKEFTKDNLFGSYKVEEAILEKAFQQEIVAGSRFLEEIYERFTKDEKKMLPDYPILTQEIFKEAQEHMKKVQNGEIGSEESPYLHDLYFDQKTKFIMPSGIWHFYHHFSHLMMEILPMKEALRKNTKTRDILDVFNLPKYKALEDHLCNTELTFRSHATSSSQLQIVYYFVLNERTKEWLLGLENAFDLTELQDLALYQDQHLLFSSCTHEGTNTDFTKQEEVESHE